MGETYLELYALDLDDANAIAQSASTYAILEGGELEVRLDDAHLINYEPLDWDEVQRHRVLAAG